ncbi:hypothetical protein GCM10009733_085690 [Nonomuraea maheshkhaliensis]|uniref:Uncharacterized protein n=1 Tax=Nonomuraea maheshkhaliensis TaxID=419590 RepID=A0ABN2GR66_9ACTN
MEQLAVLTVVGVLAGTLSATTDVFGVVRDVLGSRKGSADPAVTATAPVNDQASESRHTDEVSEREWADTARRVCTNTYPEDFDAWRKCHNEILSRRFSPKVTLRIVDNE